MPTLESKFPEIPKAPVVLLTGASGYVGGRLIPLLEQQPVVLRCLARNPDKLRPLVKEPTQIVRGDVLDPPSLDEALQGVHTAYYLVHLMSGSKDFEKEDRQAATSFAQAAKKAGVRRTIYLGGLGDDADPKLSPHLRSRHEVGQILRDSGVETIEFRASQTLKSLASASMAGFIARQGPHHDAQKSTSTGSLAWRTSFFQLNSCNSIGSLASTRGISTYSHFTLTALVKWPR